MRLDKFLKVSRVIKRRTVAKEICDNGHVSVNGRPAKAGTDISPGDRVEIRFGEKATKIEVLEIKESISARDASSLYKIIEG